MRASWEEPSSSTLRIWHRYCTCLLCRWERTSHIWREQECLYPWWSQVFRCSRSTVLISYKPLTHSQSWSNTTHIWCKTWSGNSSKTSSKRPSETSFISTSNILWNCCDRSECWLIRILHKSRGTCSKSIINRHKFSWTLTWDKPERTSVPRTWAGLLSSSTSL